MADLVNLPQGTLPLTYHDWVCVNDLDPYGRETQSDLETLQNDVLHILQETLGSNLDDPDRGLGLMAALSGTTDALQQLIANASEQLIKDPRIDSASATLTQNPDGSFLIDITVVVDDTVIGLQYATLAPGSLLVPTTATASGGT